MINELTRNIQYFLGVAFSKPLYAIVPGLAVLLTGALLVYVMPRSYYSEALLLMEFQQIPTTLVSPTVSNDRLQFIEQRVLSRNNLLALAEKHHLFPKLAESLPKSNFAGAVRSQITLQILVTDGADRNASNASVRIGFKYDDPVVASRMVSDLVSQIFEESKRIRVGRASETTKFLTQEVDTVTQRFREREAAWNKYLEQNGDSHPDRIPALILELQAKEQELSLLDRTSGTAAEEARIMEAQLRIGATQSTETTRLQSQLSAIEAEISAKSVIYSDSHPQMRILKQRLDDVKAEIAQAPKVANTELPTPDEIRRLPPDLVLVAERLANSKARQEQMTAQRTALADRISQLRSIISRGPEVEAQISANEAEKASLQRTMDDMRTKLDTARLGERLEEGDSALQIEVLEEPEVPETPAGLRRIYLAIAVCAVAVGAGAAGIYAAHLFDRTIRGTFDLANALAGETLVVIPRWKPRRRFAKAFRETGYAGGAVPGAG